MPFHTRTTTIAATAWCNAIRVYTQSGDGDIREGCHDQDVNSIGRDQNTLLQADGWFHGALHGSCDPGSTLCSISWGSGNLSILYQTHDNVIHEMRHDGRDWYLSGFTQDAIPGTDMGEVHSESGDRVVFFFQDKEGFLCYRRATNWHWEGSVRLCKAASTTPITATTWSDTKDIRVYFQDQNNSTREYCGSFDGGWVLGGFTFPETNLLGSIAAISWPGPQIRVYMQDHNNNLIEWGYGGGWSHGVLTAGVLPNADIAAFWQNSRNGFFIHVYWTSYDKGDGLLVGMITIISHPVLWEDSPPENLDGGLARRMDAGKSNRISIIKIIRKVIVRSGSIVDGLQFQFSDGTLTPWRGGQGHLIIPPPLDNYRWVYPPKTRR
ncbi:hypothetical protein K438DRAFT_1989668 [Mycena galopus ATCC 62051]|nr:hypothetical protein K438DRAFT_1989668 [Mycena galopus ATCC 62051]